MKLVMKKIIVAFVIAVIMSAMSACFSRDEVPTSEEIEEGTTKLSDGVTPVLGDKSTSSTDDSAENQDQESKEDINVKKETVKERFEEKTEGLQTENPEIGYDFDADVQNGLLYINYEGVVVDKVGNPIEAYSYITCTPDRTLLSEGDIMEGYAVDTEGKIVTDQEYIESAEANPGYDNTTYLDQLKKIADPSKEGKKVPLVNPNDDVVTDLVDDGGPYYSDIIYGNWWIDGVNGTCPTANDEDTVVGIPSKLGLAIMDSGISSSGVLDQFRLIDQDSCRLDDLIRANVDSLKLYGFYLQNIEKFTDDNGNVYFTGFLDGEYVAVWGNFSTLMNGDNVFVYAAYTGLSVNDVPTFDGGYIEIVS